MCTAHLVRRAVTIAVGVTGLWCLATVDLSGVSAAQAFRASPVENDTRGAPQVLPAYPHPRLDAATFADAQNLFYNGHYTAAAAVALALRTSAPNDLALYELRTSALLFQLKSILGIDPDREKALEACLSCQELMPAFLADTLQGQTLARAKLRAQPGDETALFFLGKLDLNYVWLQLGPLGRRTGWNEYWEARRSLDAVLVRDPAHVRARVARAWIDYIVDTKLPRGTKWLLGGGNKRRALTVMHEAVVTTTEHYTHAEAAFGLWEMQVRERNTREALDIARGLALDFPRNRDLARFLDTAATRALPGGGRR